MSYRNPGRAHCDGLDGPGVTVARAVLDAGNIRLVLPWVQHNDEAEVQRVFDQVVWCPNTFATTGH